jgi:hypothetical protein
VSNVRIALFLTQLKQHGRLAALEYIVYWYGARSPANYYSFVTKSAFIAEASKEYQENIKKYETAQTKVDACEKALATAQELARKYKEIQEDLSKAPEERKRGSFQEVHQFLSMDAKVEIEEKLDRVAEDYENMFGQVDVAEEEEEKNGEATEQQPSPNGLKIASIVLKM